MKVYFVRGGCKDAPIVAEHGKMLYGIRNDYTAYAPVKMLDINWKKYSWARFIERIEKLRPEFVVLPDFLHPEQKDVLWAQYEQVSKMVQNVGIVTKFKHSVKLIPSEAIVCLSVPAPTYAGSFDELPYWKELSGRNIHLLGGSLKRQAAFIRMVNASDARVVSLDGSTLWMKAAVYKQWFNGCRWIQEDAYDTLKYALLSAPNVTSYLQSVEK